MNVTTFDHEALRHVANKATARHWLYQRRFFAMFVVLPTLVAAIYFGLIASPVYVSTSSFVIKSPGQKSAPTISLANLVQTSGLSSGQEQTKQIIQYIRSRDALRDLQPRLDVRGMYSEPSIDRLSRFPGLFQDSSFESLFRYYGKKVGATVDQESGIAIVEVRAFDPKDAYQINGRLLGLSELLVNRLNERAEGRAISEAQGRVTAAEDRVRAARVALSEFRNRAEIIDPTQQAAGVLEVSNALRTELAALQAQLDLMVRVAPRNPAIPSLRSRVVALQRQVGSQEGRAVGTPGGIASKLSSFEKLTVEQEFATQMLTAANAALEQARNEAQKQQFYLERVVEPNLPDESVLPHRFTNVLIVFAAALCLYFIGWMLVVGVLEHSPED